MGGLYLENQLLSVSTRLPSYNVYGFGENSHLSFKQDTNFRTWGLFARDEVVSTNVSLNIDILSYINLNDQVYIA